jgi:hypothetical protein
VKNGALPGLEDIILHRKDGLGFVLSFEYLTQSLAERIEEMDLAPAN